MLTFSKLPQSLFNIAKYSMQKKNQKTLQFNCGLTLVFNVFITEIIIWDLNPGAVTEQGEKTT